VVTARRGSTALRQVFSSASAAGCVELAVVGTGWAIAAARVEHLDYAAAGMVVLAVGLEAMECGREQIAKASRKDRATRPDGPHSGQRR
jgi:hypothetical protein